ncbi:unnamed protein product [Prorocentrum cordatum]|uniref:Uncharacterized protein n=1 Tax=Prorocentrum cordatum TaxID=2364126 RepID=A0ABN9TDB4_9DINO|nr:unnamed protein product [Polarella glacialis]
MLTAARAAVKPLKTRLAEARRDAELAKRRANQRYRAKFGQKSRADALGKAYQALHKKHEDRKTRRAKANADLGPRRLPQAQRGDRQGAAPVEDLVGRAVGRPARANALSPTAETSKTRQRIYYTIF